MPCYSLYLTNQPVTGNPTSEIKVVSFLGGSNPVLNNSRISSTWNINFDGMFKGENLNYRKCRVRVKTLASLVEAGGTFAAGLTNVVCSLSTNYNAYRTYDKTLLSLSNVRGNFVSNAVYDFNCDTMDSVGVNVNVPMGNQLFTISVGSPTNPFALYPLETDFFIDFMLIFELYDKIDQ